MRIQHGFRTGRSTAWVAALLAFTLAGGVSAASVSTNGLVLVDLTHPESYNSAMVNITGDAGSYGVGMVFDNVFSGDTYRWLVNKKSCWAAYEFEVPTVVNAYGIWNANTTSSPGPRAPKDFQVLGSNDGANWTTLDQQTGETGWVQAEMRLYRFDNATAYKRYQFNVSTNNGDTYTQIHELEFYQFIPAGSVLIEGSPLPYGTAVPAYGLLANVGGQTTDLSVSSSWMAADESVLATCAGWIAYTNAGSGSSWVSIEQGAGSSVSFACPDAPTKFVWQFVVSNLITAVASEQGTITGAGRYNAADTATLTAVPASGYRFVCWTGDVSFAQSGVNPLALPADQPRRIGAIYHPIGVEAVQYVSSTGSDTADGNTPTTARKTIATAVQYINYFGADGGTVRVADGIYPVSSPVILSNPIRVISESPDPSRVMVSNTTGSSEAIQERRVFILTNSVALLSGLTIAKGEAYNRNGGNVYIASAGGTVSNCVIVSGYARNNGQAGGLWADGGLVTHCIFRDNTTGSASVSWSGNRAGVLYGAGSARIENCLIETSRYSTEAHLTKVSGTAVMRNCTIVNSALTSTSTTYGGAYPIYTDSLSATIQNVVVAGITNSLGIALAPRGSGTNIMMRCATDTAAPLNANCLAGTVQTFFRDYAARNYRPREPLIDKGATLASYPAFDLAGNPRIQGSRIDIGAFESPAACSIVTIR